MAEEEGKTYAYDQEMWFVHKIGTQLTTSIPETFFSA